MALNPSLVSNILHYLISCNMLVLVLPLRHLEGWREERESNTRNAMDLQHTVRRGISMAGNRELGDA